MIFFKRSYLCTPLYFSHWHVKSCEYPWILPCWDSPKRCVHLWKNQNTNWLFSFTFYNQLLFPQNFGPKCNFKKKRLQVGDFSGFPASTKFVQEKFSAVDTLKGYQTIEQCSLEYTPESGSSIDPHIDDCWIWGER